MKKYYSRFDTVKFRNIKVFLNSENFPYDNLNIDFDKNQYTILYEMFARFRYSYYNEEKTPVGVTYSNFKTYSPLIIIDCSKQNDSLKSGTIDVKIEVEAAENFPAKTSLYCLIIHDRVVTYSPLSNAVKLLP